MLKVILMKGLPGSGKTTFAKNLIDSAPNSHKRISKDDLRAMLDNSHWSKDSEKMILEVRDTLILKALDNKKHVIIDDTNLAPKHEQQIRELVKGKAEVLIQDFTDVDIDTCIQRDLKRANSVGAKVIRGMYNSFLKSQEKIEWDDSLPTAVICDLDGTLCLMNGRNPYDASTCENDLLNELVAEIIQSYTDVLLVSGREDKYRPQTEAFLEKHGIKYTALWMRATDDKRKDWIVKREIFDNEIRGKFNIKFVLDDRNRVVEMWRDMGLVVLQVADGDF